MRFSVPDMSCSHCVRTVTQAIQTLDPQAQIHADIGAHTLNVETTRAPAEVERSLQAAGYPAQQI